MAPGPQPSVPSSPGPSPRAPELARRLPRVVIGVALALPVLLVIGALVASQLLSRQPAPGPGEGAAPLRLAEVPTPGAAGADCARLMAGLASMIDTEDGLLPRRTLVPPQPGTVAWGGREDTEGRPVEGAVVLRCGLPRPPELTPTAALLDVDGVRWVERAAPGGASTWVTVDRAVYVGLTLPAGSGSAAIQDVSRGVKITLANRLPTG